MLIIGLENRIIKKSVAYNNNSKKKEKRIKILQPLYYDYTLTPNFDIIHTALPINMTRSINA